MQTGPSKTMQASTSKRSLGSMRESEPALEFLRPEQDYPMEEADLDRAMAEAEAQEVPIQLSSFADAGNE